MSHEDQTFFNNNQNDNDNDNLPLSPEQNLILKDEITQSLANQILMSEKHKSFNQNSDHQKNLMQQQLQQDQQNYLRAQKTWLTVRSDREEEDAVSDTNDISNTDKAQTAA